MAKKILQDEILNGKQLDNVAGGTVDETDWDIAYFFNQKWPIDFPEDWDEAVALLKNMFKKAGVDYDPNEREPNVYSVIVNGEVGRTIKREEALRTLADYIQRNPSNPGNSSGPPSMRPR